MLKNYNIYFRGNFKKFIRVTLYVITFISDDIIVNILGSLLKTIKDEKN